MTWVQKLLKARGGSIRVRVSSTVVMDVDTDKDGGGDVALTRRAHGTKREGGRR